MDSVSCKMYHGELTLKELLARSVFELFVYIVDLFWSIVLGKSVFKNVSYNYKIFCWILYFGGFILDPPNVEDLSWTLYLKSIYFVPSFLRNYHGSFIFE